MPSFEAVPMYLREARQNGDPDMVITLVGTKCDKVAERMVSYEEGQAFANRFGLRFFEVSSESWYMVEEAFVTTTQVVFQKVHAAQGYHHLLAQPLPHAAQGYQHLLAQPLPRAAFHGGDARTYVKRATHSGAAIGATVGAAIGNFVGAGVGTAVGALLSFGIAVGSLS